MVQEWRRAITAMVETPGRRDPDQDFFICIFAQAIADLIQRPLPVDDLDPEDPADARRLRGRAESNKFIERERARSDRFLFGDGLYARYRSSLLVEAGLDEGCLLGIACRAMRGTGITIPPCMARAIGEEC